MLFSKSIVTNRMLRLSLGDLLVWNHDQDGIQNSDYVVRLHNAYYFTKLVSERAIN